MATAQQERERVLRRDVARLVEPALPGVEVLAVELTGRDRFCVFVDHPAGVDHALCERVTSALDSYRRDYGIDVSSPGPDRPLRKPAHFRNAIGRQVALRTPDRKRLRGEVVSADDRKVTVKTTNEDVEVPYEAIVRGNLIDERQA
jgi:ribosome maturation factor RimP